MKYLLDTNACIRLMRGDENVRNHLCSKTPDDCAISMVTVFELFSGVEKCSKPRKEAVKVKRLLDAFHLLPFDWDSALHTAKVRGHLEKIGKIIGPYDLQLAGQCLALGLILVTHNSREFSRVPGLTLEDWQIG
jgi:tRNA(fMet)-specific endonuclease VapC